MIVCKSMLCLKSPETIAGKFVDSNRKADPLKRRQFFGENDYIKASRKNIKSDTPSAARDGERYRRSRKEGERRYEEVRIKEGEIVWRFRSLCRNVITAFFIVPEGSRTVSSVLPASRACVHFIVRSLQALHLQISIFFPFCYATCLSARPKIFLCPLVRYLFPGQEQLKTESFKNKSRSYDYR